MVNPFSTMFIILVSGFLSVLVISFFSFAIGYGWTLGKVRALDSYYRKHTRISGD